MTFRRSDGVDTANPLPVEDKGSESIAAGYAQVGTDPVLIVAARPGRKAVILRRYDNNVVLIGNENMAAATGGFRLFDLDQMTARLDTASAIYAMLAADPGDGQPRYVGYLELF